MSFDASAALGVDSTNCPDSNCRTPQALNIDGREAAQSFCSAIIRVTDGSNAAILSFPRKKSAAPLGVGGWREPVLNGTNVEGRVIAQP
ncbi:hypothetical protein [Actimicrobium sp. GrIS 1.19]|uniref:hypothetical protein n=1 Tax=Actimicrobium sp. GrIS 1.19 TaxID=3071708 RepID=UPI002E145C7E